MRAVLPDTTYFCVQLTGAQQGLGLPRGSIDRREHLSYWIDCNDLWLKVRPDVLFVDLRDAARAARLEQRGLTLTYLGPVAFPFTREALREALDNMRS